MKPVPPSLPDDELLSSRDLRLLLSRKRDKNGARKPFSYQTLMRWRKAGWLPYVRRGKVFFYSKRMIYELFGLNSHNDVISLDAMRAAREKGLTLKKVTESGSLQKMKRKRQLEEKLRQDAEELEELTREMGQR